MLTDLAPPAVMDTSANDLIRDLFVPALRHSIRYDRGVGFFSSGWLRLAAEGLTALAANGGIARWVTSPILSDEDWSALRQGQEAQYNQALYRALARNLDQLERDLASDTLSALAWMVADRVLEFRLAVPQGALDGDFHDKFGIFTDTEGHQISFSGSYNESIQGTRNYESIKIFCSWQPSMAPIVEYEARRFERLWENADPNVHVLSLPEAAYQRILRLRTYSRPYPAPPQIDPIAATDRPWQPLTCKLRDYQEEAVRAWFANGRRGTLEMATGTGKTITALVISVRLFNAEQRLAVIVAVPYQHLVDQWHEESRDFNYHSVLAYGDRDSWMSKFARQIMDYNSHDRSCISVITTHSTFISDAFQQALSRLRGPTLLIADEAHHLGAELSRRKLPELIPFRLALSATPERWFDDAGSTALRDYFGPTVFSFPLERAIGTCLTPYYYHPHLVPLTGDELATYEDLTQKIGHLITADDKDSLEALRLLLIKRARVLNNAENKLPTLAALVDQEPHIAHALFYCTPEQIDEVVKVLGNDKGLLIHTFTAREDRKQRQELLLQFARGDLQGLVAMKCLDEGVDVPATGIAYILASSSNPREFIQRRGRILRKYPGKDSAIIHDLIATPPLGTRRTLGTTLFNMERSLLRRELQRFSEFARCAINKHQALDVVWALAKAYDLLDI